MKKAVILTALNSVIFTQVKNEDGSPKLDKNDKPFGYIRVENPSTVDLAYAYENGGVRRGQSALVAMTVEAWEKSKRFYTEGMEIAGNVRIVESLEKGPGFQPKMAGRKDNAIPCTIGGKQIFRSREFDPSGKLEDVLIEHDNFEEISAAAKATVTEALNRP